MADTPLMKQYKEMKSQYSDMVLFFRLGDFYEMFDEDAKEVSALLNLTLTHRGDSPMCGIPYHAAKNYIKRLLDCGKKIAICEQMELSENSKALARREVVRIVTPATVVDEDFLDDKSFNYIICFFQYALAFCDVSTGDFHIRALDPKNKVQAVRSVLQQLSPREILVCEDEYFLDFDFKAAIDSYPAMVTKLAPWYFSQKGCYKILCEQAKVKSLAAYGLKDNDKLVCPAGALIRYITETSKSSVSHLTDYKVDNEDSFVSMDESSRKNLELFTNLYDGSCSRTTSRPRRTSPPPCSSATGISSSAAAARSSRSTRRTDMNSTRKTSTAGSTPRRWPWATGSWRSTWAAWCICSNPRTTDSRPRGNTSSANASSASRRSTAAT